MIAAVTGGTGFIGRVLVERLLKGGEFSEVRVLSRGGTNVPQGARLVRGDLLHDPLEAFVEGANVLFHCAGELRDTQAMRAVHVDGTRRLLAAARGRGARWIQLSSVGAYGRVQRAGAVEEDSPLTPNGEYEVTKTEADRLVAQSGLPYAILRPSNVFGPGMRNRSLLQWARALERGWFAFVGDDEAIATYIYVNDVADALAACASTQATGVYIVSDDRSMHAFVGAMAAALDKRPPTRRLPEEPLRLVARTLSWLPGFPLTTSRLDALTRRVSYPSRRIRAELNFRCRISVEAGLRNLLARNERRAVP